MIASQLRSVVRVAAGLQSDGIGGCVPCRHEACKIHYGVAKVRRVIDVSGICWVPVNQEEMSHGVRGKSYRHRWISLHSRHGRFDGLPRHLRKNHRSLGSIV